MGNTNDQLRVDMYFWWQRSRDLLADSAWSVRVSNDDDHGHSGLTIRLNPPSTAFSDACSPLRGQSADYTRW